MTEKLSVEEERWVEQVAKLVRRNLLASTAKECGGFFQGERERVRAFEIGEGVMEKIKSFGTGERNVPPLMDKLGIYLAAGLRKKFPIVEALVFLGSTANGGGIVESWLGGGPHDLDWGMITKRPVCGNEGRQISTAGRRMVADLAQKLGLGEGFETDPCLSPANLWVVNLRRKEDVLALLCGEGSLFGLREFAIERLLLFLRPSFPREVNERNRRIFFEFYRDLLKKNPGGASLVALRLMETWGETTRFKEKYFAPQGKGQEMRKRDALLAQKVEKRSPELFSSRFLNDLERKTRRKK